MFWQRVIIKSQQFLEEMLRRTSEFVGTNIAKNILRLNDMNFFAVATAPVSPDL